MVWLLGLLGSSLICPYTWAVSVQAGEFPTSARYLLDDCKSPRKEIYTHIGNCV